MYNTGSYFKQHIMKQQDKKIIRHSSFVENLDHMKELAEKGMQNSHAFDQLFDTYIRTTQTASIRELKDAIEYLKENSVGTLNTENMIDMLEDTLSKKEDDAERNRFNFFPFGVEMDY